MVRKAPSVAPEITPVPIVAPPTPEVVAAAPAAAKKPRKTRVVAETPEVVVETAPAPAPIEAPAELVNEVNATHGGVAVSTTATKIAEFASKLHQLSTVFNAVKNEFKILEKSVLRDLKNAQKSQRKKRINPNKQPSGFVKPTLISDELAVFLGKPLGSLVPRIEVSKLIHAYIKENNLQDTKNRRIIKADSRLSDLLKLNGEQLSYFSIQKTLAPHFIKTGPAAVAV